MIHMFLVLSSMNNYLLCVFALLVFHKLHKHKDRINGIFYCTAGFHSGSIEIVTMEGLWCLLNRYCICIATKTNFASAYQLSLILSKSIHRQ